MSYYAILVPAYTGHLNPMIALAHVLQRRGHRIVLLAPLDAEAKIHQAGLEFLPLAEVEFPRGEWERTAAEMGRRSGLPGLSCAASCLGRLARGIHRALPEIMAKERFAGLIMDQIAFGAEGVCEVSGVPLAVACNSLLLHTELGVPPEVFSWGYSPSIWARLRNLGGYAVHNSTGWPVLREVIPYRIRHGLSRPRMNHMNVMPPSLVQVTQLPAFLDFPRRHLPDHFHYTGPWIETASAPDIPFPWDRLDGRPMIYASLGTLQNRQEHLYSLIAQACEGLGAQVVLSLGRKEAAIDKLNSADTIAVDYAPQRALLKRASLVITHGGLNTALETLSAGVPMVALPITNDQPGVAARLHRLGVSETVPLARISPVRLRKAVTLVLHAAQYRDQARKCAALLQHIDGPGLAADLIETAFAHRRSVTREK